MSNLVPHPLVLKGELVTLEPFDSKHLNELRQLAQDERIWEFYSKNYSRPHHFNDLVATALGKRATGSAYPFIIRYHPTGRIVGSTQYFDIDAGSRSLEIGFTWLAPEYWGSAVNLECKLLLLSYVFEWLQLVRVQFRTGGANKRSQKAITRIGAKYEGVLRKSRALENGAFIDTVYFSIIDDDWPEVKTSLEKLLAEKMKGSRL